MFTQINLALLCVRTFPLLSIVIIRVPLLHSINACKTSFKFQTWFFLAVNLLLLMISTTTWIDTWLKSTFFSQGLPNWVALSNFHRTKEDQFVLKLGSRLYQSNGISPNAKFVLSTLKREEQYVLISAIWTLNELHTSFSRIFIFNLNIYIIRFSDIGKSFKLQTDSQSDSDR